jgi:hypothetical protein
MGHKVQRQEHHGSAGEGFVVQQVDAPPSVVLRCLESFEDYAGMIPVVRQVSSASSIRVADGVTGTRCSYRISKFWLRVSVVHTVDHGKGLVRFELDPFLPGLVLREASGFWMVQPVEDNPSQCRVWLVAGLKASSLLPHFIVDYAAERALRRATSWLRPHVEALWALEKQRPHREALPDADKVLAVAAKKREMHPQMARVTAVPCL